LIHTIKSLCSYHCQKRGESLVVVLEAESHQLAPLLLLVAQQTVDQVRSLLLSSGSVLLLPVQSFPAFEFVGLLRVGEGIGELRGKDVGKQYLSGEEVAVHDFCDMPGEGRESELNKCFSLGDVGVLGAVQFDLQNLSVLAEVLVQMVFLQVDWQMPHVQDCFLFGSICTTGHVLLSSLTVCSTSSVSWGCCSCWAAALFFIFFPIVDRLLL
jgi:hypothetical protein